MTGDLDELRTRTRELCARFPDEYWRDLQPDGYPTELVDAMTRAGHLAALIPPEYGGLGLSLTDASIVMEEINRSGGHSAAVDVHPITRLRAFRWIRSALRVDRQHHALRSEGLRELSEQVRPCDRGGIHRHLVGAGIEHRLRVLSGPDPAADGEGDEDVVRCPSRELDDRVASLV